METLETERKQAEEKLRESEERIHTIVSNTPVVIWALDKEGIFTLSEGAGLKTLGLKPGEVVGQSVSEVYRDVPKILEYNRRALAGESFVSVVEVGELVFECHYSPIRDKNGEVIGMVGVSTDITERKKAEKALRESEERYRALVNLGGGVEEAIIMRQDTEQGEGIHTFVSDEWPRTTGYSRKELLGMSFSDLLHPKHREASLKRYKRRMSGETIPGLFEMSIIRKDGTEVPIELTSAYTTYRGQRANVAFIRDITERKQAEEEISQLARFPSENPNPVMRVAKNGTILYANEAALPLLNEWGCQVGQLLPDYLSQSILGILGSGSPKYIEVECGEQTFSFMFSPILDAGYVNLYGRDITERKQAEEREKELQQELNLSSRLASIGELAAGVAHELNNPLTGILGFSERLMRKSSDEKAKEGLEKIHSEALRAARVVQNLRTFARRREPKKEYSDANNIVQKALELRAYELKTGNIEVVTDLVPRLPKVKVDFYQIQEVFLNIILNAEQAMTEANSGGKLSIKTRRVGGYIRASFTDDGPGIPADQLGKVFDPFFTTRGEKGGTGLGLSVCHGIVTEHGGKIYAKSNVGKETTFFVELPLATEGQVNASLNTN